MLLPVQNKKKTSRKTLLFRILSYWAYEDAFLLYGGHLNILKTSLSFIMILRVKVKGVKCYLLSYWIHATALFRYVGWLQNPGEKGQLRSVLCCVLYA